MGEVPDVSYDGSATFGTQTSSVKIKIILAIIVAILITFIVVYFLVFRNRED